MTIFKILFIYKNYPRIAFRSSSGVVIDIILNLSTKIFNTLGEIKAGKVGPSLMLLTPRYNSVSSMQTAFCSYQESTIDSGNSLTEQPKASASTKAIFIAE